MTNPTYIAVCLKGYTICGLKFLESETTHSDILSLVDALHDQGFTLQPISETQYQELNGEATVSQIIQSWAEE